MVIKRVKGDTYNLDVKFESAEGTDIDLTGCTVFFTVKRAYEDVDSLAIINKTITSHTAPTTGNTSVSFNASDVDVEGEFYYDFKIKDTGNKITSVFTDKFILANHITIRTS